MIDLAEIETTDAEMMTEVEEEMTVEILDEIIVEISAAETTDVEMTGITAPEDTTVEILMETMIGIVQNAIIPTLLEEWNVTDVVLQSQVVETLAAEIQTVEIQAEATSETEILGAVIQAEATLETEILGAEILAEATLETEILGVEILAEATLETEILGVEILGTGPGTEKRRFLLIMIGLAQSATTLIFLSVRNATAVESQRVVTLVEVITETDEIVNQEMTGQVGMTENREDLEKQEVNLQITPTTGGQNRLMLVQEEEIAMIK